MHIGEAFTEEGRSILLKLQFAAFQGWTRVRTSMADYAGYARHSETLDML